MRGMLSWLPCDRRTRTAYCGEGPNRVQPVNRIFAIHRLDSWWRQSSSLRAPSGSGSGSIRLYQFPAG